MSVMTVAMAERNEGSSRLRTVCAMEGLRTWRKSTVAYILFCRDSDDDNLIMLAVGRIRLCFCQERAHEDMTHEQRRGLTLLAVCAVRIFCALFQKPVMMMMFFVVIMVVLFFCFVFPFVRKPTVLPRVYTGVHTSAVSCETVIQANENWHCIYFKMC